MIDIFLSLVGCFKEHRKTDADDDDDEKAKKEFLRRSDEIEQKAFLDECDCFRNGFDGISSVMAIEVF